MFTAVANESYLRKMCFPSASASRKMLLLRWAKVNRFFGLIKISSLLECAKTWVGDNDSQIDKLLVAYEREV